MPLDFYNSTWEVMRAVKENLLSYSRDKNNNRVLKKIITWNIGFVFPRTVYPALSIFPVQKNFLPRQSGGRQHVEYVLSIDVYSPKKIKTNEAKAFCLDAIDDMKQASKRSIRMADKSGVQNSFNVKVTDEFIHEPTFIEEGSGFMSTTSIRVEVSGLHDMNTDGEHFKKILETDYDDFFDRVSLLIQKEAELQNFTVGSWITKVAKKPVKYPAVLMLPGNERVDESLTNNKAILTRPIDFHVITRGIPKWEVVRDNIRLADNLIIALEKHYQVEGYAQENEIESVDYLSETEDFTFASVIRSEYRSRVTLQTSYPVTES